VEAYQLYLKGRAAVSTYSDFDAGMRYFQQAIERDPAYALAYLGLAYYYTTVSDWRMPPDEALPRAREAAEKALRLDPSLAEAHTWLGYMHWWYDQDLAATRRELETALAMQPDSAITRAYYGWYLVSIGEVEAGLAEARRGAELEPLSAEINATLGFTLYAAHRYDEAIQQLRTTLAIDPDYWFTYEWLGRVYARQGRFAEATAALQTAQRLDPPQLEIESLLGRVYADAGDRARAVAVLHHLRERSKEEYVSGSYLATVQIGLGQKDEAFESLARAAAQHTWLVGFWKVDPELDPVRSDPRFAVLLAKVGQKP
jgi:serine/threonine-protein kinase